MSNSENRVQEENLKKAWIEPEMGEINVNGGTVGGIFENSAIRGTLS